MSLSIKGKKKKVKGVLTVFPLSPSNDWIYQIHCLNMLREVGFPKAVSLVVHLLLEKIWGAFKELPTTPGTFWKICCI